MAFFRYLIDSQANVTLLLYILITFFSFIFGCKSQKAIKDPVTGQKTIQFKMKWFIMAFFLLWFFSFFNMIGNDFENYISIFNDSTIQIVKQNIFIEPGYRFLNILIRTIISDSYVGVGIIKTLSLILIFCSLYKIQDRVHIGFSLLAYVSLFYFESFNLIRSSLAAAIILYAWILILKGKKRLSIVLILVSITIHYSSIICLFVYMLYIFLKNLKLHIILPIMFLISSLIVILSNTVIKFFVSNVEYFLKYSYYINIEGSFGIMQLVYYIPVIIAVVYTHSKNTNSFLNFSIVLAFTGLSIALVGYQVGMISRMNAYFGYNFVILIPCFVQQVRLRSKNFVDKKKEMQISKQYRLDYKTTFAFSFIFFLFRFILDIAGYMAASGIYPFKMWI